MTTHGHPDVKHSTELSPAIERELPRAQPAAGLPRRTAGSSGCPSPDRALVPAHDPAVLRAVLDGLHRLDDGALA